jgi:hypothetical protein
MGAYTIMNDSRLIDMNNYKVVDRPIGPKRPVLLAELNWTYFIG